MTSRLQANGQPKTPLSPSHQTTSPSPIVPKVQQSLVSTTSAATSNAASNTTSFPPPPSSIPPPPKLKPRIFRPRNVVAVLLLTTLAYGGAVWYSFESDNFHDFF